MLAIQVCAGVGSAAAFISLALSAGSPTSRVTAAIAGVVIAGIVSRAVLRSRTHHRLTNDGVEIRSYNFSKDIPTRSIAGVGLAKTELKSAIKAYSAWAPML